MEFSLAIELASILLLALLALLAFLVSGQAIRRRGFGKQVVRDLVVYLILAISWEIASLLGTSGLLAPLGIPTPWWLSLMGSLLLATAFLIASSAFFETSLRSLPWILVGAIAFLGALLLAMPDMQGPWVGLEVGPILVKGAVIQAGTFSMSRPGALLAVLILGWALVSGRTFYLILPAYRNANRSLHKNRVIVWTVAALIIFFGDLLLFGGIPLGGLLRVAGGCAAGCALISNRLEGAVQRGLRAFNALMISLLAVSLYGVAFLVAVTVIEPAPGASRAAASLIQGGFLAFMVNPVLLLMLRRMDKAVFRFRSDSDRAGRAYRREISNIIELNRLARTALEQIMKIFHSRWAQLYLVDEELPSGAGTYVLRRADHEGAEHGGGVARGELYIEPGRLSAGGPAAAFFRQRRLPLTRQDLDRLPRYKNMPAGERKWFMDTAAEVYAPICTEKRWVGLFALGPKIGGERYYPEDLAFLKALADRTAIVLENARRLADLENGGQGPAMSRPGRAVERTQASQAGRPVEWFDFGQLAAETLDPLQAMAVEKGVLLRIELADDLPPVAGDRKALAIAMYQLVHNAIKFNRPNGRVWAICRLNSGDLAFDVRDTGAGIPRSKLDTLWTIHSQKDGRAEAAAGLALVKKIVDAHGGQVWAESWEGKGSVFGFKIPVERIAGGRPPTAGG